MSERDNIFDVEEVDELDDELGIDYHTQTLGNPSFGFGGMVGGTSAPSSADAWAGRIRPTAAVTGVTLKGAPMVAKTTPSTVVLRERADMVRLKPASTAWDALAARGYGRNGCPVRDPFERELRRIAASLALAEVQREATSEHNKLRAIERYRTQVLMRLQALLHRRCP